MPRRARRQSANPPPRGYARLGARTSLLAWILDRLGYDNPADLLKSMKKADEGFDANGASGIRLTLAGQSNRLNGVSPDDLRRYDDNIAKHLSAMNGGRAQPVVLRYFQHLAALCAEIYLDAYFRSPRALLESLNDFVGARNAGKRQDGRWERFAESDLRKLAFWMATGSGKTLLLHLNYRQFLHYRGIHCGKPLANILLITPNEGLSRQHLDELRASNIPAARLDPTAATGALAEPGVIQVTEITKLVEEKRGGGVRVPVEAFEGDNLIFVDEGHKGAGGEAWRDMREKLGENGFTFEYSATFSQALAAAKDESLINEYGKSIAFDYSYRHFYKDGYGKDFHILNLRRQTSDGLADTLLLANLLSFYQQILAYERGGAELRRYNLERPLWTFVGGSVNAVRRERGKPTSDVLTVVQFLHRALSQPEWAADGIERILKGESGLTNDAGRDIFAGRFDYLLHANGGAAAADARGIHRDILRRVAHAETAGGLRLRPLRGSDGEIGLQAFGADDYFGVINIGDASAFRKLAQEQEQENRVQIEEDAFAESLFARIGEPESGNGNGNGNGNETPPVNVLIGAKKFMEGWNSWRVSSMGLLNIGRSEGSQIIQLFGRGVRLKGRGMSLKRSAALGGRHPDNMRLLETLDIFAIRADYMAQFRDYLEDEGVPAGDMAEMELPIQPNMAFLDKGLVIPRPPDGKEFETDDLATLRLDEKMNPVTVFAGSEAQELASAENEIGERSATSGATTTIGADALNLVDWSAAYSDLLAHRDARGWDNLAIPPSAPREIIAAGEKAYTLIADENLANPRRPRDAARLRETVATILRRYADAFYRRRQRRWESDNLVYKPLDAGDANLTFNIREGDSDSRARYLIRAPAEMIERIEQLIADCDTSLYASDGDNPRRIHFASHIYQPLPVKADGEGVEFSPPGLEPSERKFVTDLRAFCCERSAELPPGAEIFLLRNLTRGKGVGFFTENDGFYPDFILWIKTPAAQRIVFVEPHGMIHENLSGNDQKARLYETLPALSAAIAQRSPANANVVLDSFIISATAYQDLRGNYGKGWSRERFAAAHILFADLGNGYVGEIIGG